MLCGQLQLSTFVVLLNLARPVEWPENIVVASVNVNSSERLVGFVYKEAEQALKKRSLIPQKLTFSIHYEPACTDNETMEAVVKLQNLYSPNVLIGIECATGLTPASMYATAESLLLISDGTSSDIYADTNKYQTLTRISYTMGPLGDAIEILLLRYNWNRIAIIRSRTSFCDVGLSGIYTNLWYFNIAPEIYADNNNEIKLAVKLVREMARIVILCFGYNPVTATKFLQAAHAAGLVNSEYVFILPCYSINDQFAWKPWEVYDDLNEADQQYLMSVYQNTLVIVAEGQEMSNIYGKHIENVTGLTLTAEERVFLPLLYESIYLYGYALNQSVTKGIKFDNVSAILDVIARVKYTSITGEVIFNADSDRVPSYFIYSKNENDMDLTPAMRAYIRVINGTLGKYEFQPIRPMRWNTPNNIPPPAIPRCGFLDDACGLSATEIVGITVGTVVGCVVVVGIVILIYRRKQFEKLLYIVWQINAANIKPVTRSQLENSVTSLKSLVSNSSVLAQSKMSKLGEYDVEHMGIYETHIVFIQKYKKRHVVRLSRGDLVLLKQIKEIYHDNLNSFIGASFDKTDYVYFLWGKCSKGSLRRLLFDKEIDLDATFKISFAKDIINGLEYLHKTPIGCHLNLTTDNCVIDSRWSIQLRNFGLEKMLENLKQDNSIINIDDAEMIWRSMYHKAPEILSGETAPNVKASDVYSLAIVIFQILYRQEPYEGTHLTRADVMNQIEINALRPAIPDTTKDNNPSLIEIMRNCWIQDWKSRPNIVAVKTYLLKFTKNRNLLDHFINLLEKHSKNLEKVVDERTQKLIEERKKLDDLLYQILPKTIVHLLKQQESVMPESYDSVTVCFSNVVGFDELYKIYKPDEVIKVLNRLYTQMESYMQRFNVYKVETIGDAFMIVSGLPERNGPRHVTEIADLALSVCKDFNEKIIQSPGKLNLHIRIGIHSGPVAAGVIGLKLPKYCLFGDTVNFASRMNTTGLAGKIHISSMTRNLLIANEFYDINMRGQIDVKGKGVVTTYWLNSKLYL